jgi:hypothetical protein
VSFSPLACWCSQARSTSRRRGSRSRAAGARTPWTLTPRRHRPAYLFAWRFSIQSIRGGGGMTLTPAPRLAQQHRNAELSADGRQLVRMAEQTAGGPLRARNWLAHQGGRNCLPVSIGGSCVINALQGRRLLRRPCRRRRLTLSQSGFAQGGRAIPHRRWLVSAVIPHRRWLWHRLPSLRGSHGNGLRPPLSVSAGMAAAVADG